MDLRNLTLEDVAAAAGITPLTQPPAEGDGAYRADLWQIVTSPKGFETICETNEDGGPGDLVAEAYGDHAKMIAAAPALVTALAESIAQMEIIRRRLEDAGVGNLGAGSLGRQCDVARMALFSAIGKPRR